MIIPQFLVKFQFQNSGSHNSYGLVVGTALELADLRFQVLAAERADQVLPHVQFVVEVDLDARLDLRQHDRVELRQKALVDALVGEEGGLLRELLIDRVLARLDAQRLALVGVVEVLALARRLEVRGVARAAALPVQVGSRAVLVGALAVEYIIRRAAVERTSPAILHALEPALALLPLQRSVAALRVRRVVSRTGVLRLP